MEATAFQKQPEQVKPVLDPLRYHKHYQQDDSPYAGGSSFMERVAEGVASGMGTVAFIIVSSLMILAQKAQTRTDKANEEAAAKHHDELAQSQTDLLQQNTALTEQIHTLAERLRGLTEQVHAATCGRQSST